MEIYGFGRKRKIVRGIEREIEKIDDRLPRNGACRQFFFLKVGRTPLDITKLFL